MATEMIHTSKVGIHSGGSTKLYGILLDEGVRTNLFDPGYGFLKKAVKVAGVIAYRDQANN